MIRIELVPGFDDPTPPEIGPDGKPELPSGGIEFLTKRSAHVDPEFAMAVLADLEALGDRPKSFIRVYLTDEPNPLPGDVAALIRGSVPARDGL